MSFPMVDTREGPSKGQIIANNFQPTLDAAQNWNVLGKSRNGAKEQHETLS